MQSWIEGFQQSIDFIEKNLASSLEIEDIAQIAALSPFYYASITFSMGFRIPDHLSPA